MLNKESLEKSTDLRRGENSEFWEEFDKTLQKQRVEVTFKMDGHFYPETINSVGSPYLCEFSNKEINFFEFKPQTLNWKNSLRFKLTHVVDEIELIEVNTQKKLDLVMGILPSDSVTLEVNVFCKTFLHNIAKKKYTPLRLKFFSDYFGLDRAFLSRKLSPVKLKMCA